MHKYMAVSSANSFRPAPRGGMTRSCCKELKEAYSYSCLQPFTDHLFFLLFSIYIFSFSVFFMYIFFLFFSFFFPFFSEVIQFNKHNT